MMVRFHPVHLTMILNLTRALIVLGACAAATLILYLLRERFRKAVVSHLPLWEFILKKTPMTSLLRNTRRLLSYLLQMAILATLILSITDTGFGKDRKRRAIAILIDASTSMGATDVKPSRFEQAKAFAESLARSMRQDDQALLLEMTDAPRVVRAWTHDPQEIIAGIRTLTVSRKGNDFVSALRLSAAALEAMDAPERELWVLSDGAYDPSPAAAKAIEAAVKDIRRSGITVRHHRTGKESSNLAITRFSARQNLKEKLKLSASIVISALRKDEAGSAGGPAGGTCDAIALRILAGGSTVFNKPVPKSRFGQVISLDMPVPADRTVSARITPADPSCGQDFLEADNTATIELPEQLQLGILAVTRENTYLMAALLLSPLWDVEVIPPGAAPSRKTYDVVVADGAPVPGEVRRKGTLYLVPKAEGFPLKVKGVIEAPSFDDYDYNHPALRWTNLYNVNVASSLEYETTQDCKVIASSQKGPLIMEMKEAEGSRAIVMAFSVQDTDMGLRTTWPLLFINTLYHLAGTALQVSSASNSPGESSIMPRWLPEAMRIRQQPQASHAFPLWVVLLLAALLVNLAEWVTFHRRWTV